MVKCRPQSAGMGTNAKITSKKCKGRHFLIGRQCRGLFDSMMSCFTDLGLESGWDPVTAISTVKW